MSTSPASVAPGDVDLVVDLTDTLSVSDQASAAEQSTQTQVLADSLADSLSGASDSHARRPGVLRASWLVAVADAAGLALPAAFMHQGRLAIAAFALLAVGAYHGAGLYKPRLHLSVLSELPLLATRAVLAAVVCGTGVRVLALHPGVNRFAVDVAVAFAVQITFRTVAYQLVRSSRESGRVCHPTLVIGGGVVANHLVRTLEDSRSYGLGVVGVVDVDPVPDPEAPHQVAHIGTLQELPALIAQNKVEVLLVAFGAHSEREVVEVMRTGSGAGCDVFVVPRLFEIHSQPGHVDHIGAVPVVRIRRPVIGEGSWLVKRAFDMTLAATALVLLSPLLALVAWLVRREGGPGFLFHQVRVGRDGREFELLKFRSLKPVDDAESATKWNIAHDDRLGPVGKFLRRSSIDELPQLWNVLRGDMSIVGPRPERPHFVATFRDEIPFYVHRHRVPCGLTGLAQVSGLRGDTSIADRARYDNYYIENWSLFYDLKIILATFREVVGARGK